MSEWQLIPIEGDDYRVPLKAYVPEGEATGTMVMMPAMGVRGRYYDTFAQGLAAHGIYTVVMEYRGHGESALRASHRTDWGYREIALIDLPASIAWAREQCPDVPLYIGGHSLGGQLSLVYAAHHPNTFDGAIIIACSSPFHGHYATKQARGIKFCSTVAPVLTRTLGYFPGDRLGFAGRESRGTMDDWNQLAKHDRFRVRGVDDDLESRICDYNGRALTIAYDEDDMAPAKAVASIYGRLASAAHEHHVFTSDDLACRADHFRWAKSPAPVCVRIAQWHEQGA